MRSGRAEHSAVNGHRGTCLPAESVLLVSRDGPFPQTVLTYYMFNTARYDSQPRGFKTGLVMPSCTFPCAVAKATTSTPKTVREANIWLHQQRLIKITNRGTPLGISRIWEGTDDEPRSCGRSYGVRKGSHRRRS